MIWEPFVLAVVLGLIVSTGLYFAYLWPTIEPIEGDEGDEEGDEGNGAEGRSPEDLPPIPPTVSMVPDPHP